MKYMDSSQVEKKMNTRIATNNIAKDHFLFIHACWISCVSCIILSSNFRKYWLD